jgi:hypothetical protein
LASFLYMFASTIAAFTRSFRRLRLMYIVGNVVSSFFLLLTYYNNTLHMLIFVLPLWGISMSSVHTLSSLYPRMLEKYAFLSSYSSQLTLFLVIPIVY